MRGIWRGQGPSSLLSVQGADTIQAHATSPLWMSLWCPRNELLTVAFVSRSRSMLKSKLLAEIQKEIYLHDFGTFLDEPL